MTVYKWFVGFFLAVIMVFALAVNAFLFSARAFQYSLAQIAPQTNGILSLKDLDGIEDQIEQIAERTRTQRGERAHAEERVATLQAQLDSTRQQLSHTMTDLALAVATMEERLGGPTNTQPAASLDSEALEARAASVMSRPGVPADQSEQVSIIRQMAQRLRDLRDRAATLSIQLSNAQGELRAVGGSLNESDGQILALKRTIVGERFDQYDRVRAEAAALRRTSPWGVGASFVSAHPTFLSTLLVLLMGALGAILYLFPAYMSRAEPVTFAEIAVRMIFGMVTALAFYIVANATLAGLSFVPGQASAANAALLNPFTVGLVGIIAGVTADDIAKWIQRRGSEILGGRPGTPPPTTTTTAAPASTDGGFTGVNPHGGPPPV